ncbi:MAG: VOC family protein [Candidatus Latescibacteria bacterium]|nr:VOC family protein [Candidatus Latescibacterota bacterium]
MSEHGVDRGLTHIALTVRNLQKSIEFYMKYAGMLVVHQREDVPGKGVAGLSDLTRSFMVTLLTSDYKDRLSWPSHLGVAVSSHEEVERLASLAREEGCLQGGPEQRGPNVGYIAWVADPDGNTIEISHGQQIDSKIAEYLKTHFPNRSGA